MATDGRSKAIIDTSVLINFLRIDRVELLASHPSHRFVIVDLIANEVTRHYADQQARLGAALAAGHLLPDDPPETIDPAELALFAAMQKLKIGEAERAAIAAAKARKLALAMDDERAWKRASTFCSGVPRENTVSIMVSLIKADVIDVARADVIKAEWATHHRFRLKIASFAELV